MQDRTSKTSKARALARVSIAADLVSRARAAGIDVEATVETALRDAIKGQMRREAWQAENREALASSNRYFEKSGLPLAKFRTW